MITSRQLSILLAQTRFEEFRSSFNKQSWPYVVMVMVREGNTLTRRMMDVVREEVIPALWCRSVRRSSLRLAGLANNVS
jgi:hypothetical protein